jgi:putative flippase GtrA
LSDVARTTFLRWLKFNAVGGIGIAVQLGALSVFRGLLHLNYLVATACAVETAVIHNFLWHERFTWSDRVRVRSRESLARFLRFNATNGLISIAGNLLLMRLLVEGAHWNYLLANIFSIAICSLLNFFASDRLVFEP